MTTRSAPKRKPAKRQSGVCAAILRLRPANLDEAAIRAIVGDRVAKNLSEVAAEFGVEATTLRSGWRVQGMPGDAGAWPFADILLWRLRHEAEIADKRRSPEELSDRELERRKEEAEARKLELQADKLAREEDIAIGKLIDREAAATAVKTAGAVLAERLMKVPAQIEPTLPSNVAAETVSSIQRMIRRELVAFAETMGRDVLKEGRSIDL